MDVNGQKFLVDCGLQQGQDEKNGNILPFHAAALDFVLVTHAHIDHSGRLPLLVKNGVPGQNLCNRRDLPPVIHHAAGQRAYPRSGCRQ